MNGSLSDRGNLLGGLGNSNADDKFGDQLVLPSFKNPAFEKSPKMKPSSSPDKRTSFDQKSLIKAS